MQKHKIKNLVWFRNDLRTHDNTVLTEATKDGHPVIGVYCFDPRHFMTYQLGFKKTEKFRAKFLIETIVTLRAQLQALHIDLLVFFNKPEISIPELYDYWGITDIYYQKEWTAEEQDIEHRLKAKLISARWHSHYNQFLFHPEDINFEISKTPQIFTVFRKKLEKYTPVRAEVDSIKQSKDNRIKNDTRIPSLYDLGYQDFVSHSKSAFPFKGGEIAAQQRVDDYIFKTKNLGVYKKTRNGLIGINYSSKLSAWLANGSISAKTIYWKVKEFESTQFKNESTYWLIFELIWRDYFKYVSLKHGNHIFKVDGILHKTYQWSKNKKQIQRWINGETFSDFVNANMLELQATGWMSNRGRQNVASYFAKDLELDWRIGAAYFEAFLIDYDVHSNYGNWMYVAGVGNDPRNRKFNVKLQSDRYDAQGTFRKLWLQSRLF